MDALWVEIVLVNINHVLSQYQYAAVNNQ
jgi:hypothetical protein